MRCAFPYSSANSSADEGGRFTFSAGLNRITPGKIASFHRADGLLSEDIGPILEDREGNLWVGDNFTIGWQGQDALWQGNATKFAPNGKPLSPITTGFTGGGMEGGTFGAAVDASVMPNLELGHSLETLVEIGESFSSTKKVRMFAGYAGWGAGQLEDELERDDWIVETAQADDPFTETPAELWADVLRRKGGVYELVARMPEDPSVN